MDRESFTFDPRPDYPYRLAVNCYQHPTYTSTDADALTLVLVHCLAAPKELWEPTLAYLFQTAGARGLKIRDAWCIDSPEQGDSAILNDKIVSTALNWRADASLGASACARSLHRFLSGLGTGVDVDFRARRLVGVGHSLGGVALVHATTYEPKIDFHAIVLVDPAILRAPKPGENGLKWMEAPSMFPDVFASREDAARYFSKHRVWKGWDRRVLDKYLEHGFRDLPTPSYPGQTRGVALKCSRRVESALYRDTTCSLEAFDYLHVLCQRTQVHLLHPEHADLVPRPFVEDISKVATHGLHASIRVIPGAGHLAVQTHPEATAAAMVAALEHQATRRPTAQTGVVSLARL